jgi:hypothetical protein
MRLSVMWFLLFSLFVFYFYELYYINYTNFHCKNTRRLLVEVYC